MTKRQAKKIGRWDYVVGVRNRAKVWKAASVIQREWWRSIQNTSRWTRGYRFGRWDPETPSSPSEPPF